MLKRHDLADPASDAPAAPLSNSEKAFNDVPYDIAVMRARRAEAMGLTYREYTLEILERGRYLSAEADAERIAEIKRRRSIRY